MFNALQETFNNVDPAYRSGAGFTTIEGFVGMVANLMIGAGISIGFIGIAYGFIQFTTTLGDPKRALDARYAVLLGAVAVLVSMLGWLIKSAIYATVGL